MNLEWIKCQDGSWCSLLAVNLAHEHFNDLEGVYIIWHGGNNPSTVYVGQGIIRDRLAAHRQEQGILTYQSLGLYVTWAQVASQYLNGVERYLHERLNPKIGSRSPFTPPIAVNLPW